jgi:YVTN family beta-propeller protein/VCBS repeat-containing protein
LKPSSFILPTDSISVAPQLELLWLAVRQSQYRWNNQKPTAAPTVNRQDSTTGLITGQLNAADYDDKALTYTVSTTPSRGTVIVDAHGSFVYVPGTGIAASGGEDTFTVTIDDATGNPKHYHGLSGLFGLDSPTIATITVRVEAATPVVPGNSAPQVGTLAYGFTVDAATGVVTGHINATDPDGDDVRYTLGTVPEQSLGSVVLDAGTGTWTFTPQTAARQHAWTTPGVDTALFSVHVSDGTRFVPIEIAVPIDAVAPINLAPVVGTQAPGTVDPSSGVVTGQVIVIDPDGEALTYALARTVDWTMGSVVVDTTTGAWTYTPTTQALFGAYASPNDVTATFSVTASDGTHTIPVTVSAPVGVSTDALVSMIERIGSTPSGVAVSSDSFLYVINSGANTVSVVHPLNGSTVTTAVGDAPSAVAVGLDGRVYVTNSGDGTVSVLNANGAAVRGPISVGRAPSGIALADGLVYVTNSADNSVSVIDSNTYSVRTITNVGSTPQGISVGADGLLYIANFGDDTVSVVNPEDDSVQVINGAGKNPYGLAVTTDGSIWVTNPLDDTVTVLTPAYNGTYTVRSIAVGTAPSAIAVGADGLLYVTNSESSSVTVIDRETLALTTVATGTTPIGLAVGPHGAIYVANAGSGSVTIISAQHHPVETIAVGVEPNRVVVGRNGELIVTNKYDGTVTVLSTNSDALAGFGLTRGLLTSSSVSGAQVAIGPDGRIYVAGSGYFTTSIVSYTPDGRYVSSTSVENFLGSTVEMVVAGDGRVYAVLSGQFGDHTLRAMNLADRSTTNILSSRKLSGLTIGLDGNLYVVDQTLGLLSVVDPDDYSTVRQIPITVQPYDTSLLAVGSDGRIYVTGQSDTGTVVNVVDPEDYSIETVSVSRAVNGIAVGADGRVYLSNYSDESVTVLSSDHSVAETLAIGLSPLGVTVGPEGKVFVTGMAATGAGYAVMVIDPDSYSLGSFSLGGYTADLVSDATNFYVLTISGYSPGGATFFSLDRVSPTPDPPIDPDPGEWTPPDDPSESPATNLGNAPNSTADLYDRLREKTNNANHGIYIETVEDGMGQKRLIVYIGGTDPNIFWLGDEQSVLGNIQASLHIPKSTHTSAIDAALAGCTECSEIMLVGYSQGGIDAQNLAWFAYPDKVTTVVTFGAPIMMYPQSGDATVHIQDLLDPITGAFNAPHLSLANYLVGAGFSEISGVMPRWGWPESMETHTNKTTYTTLGDRFDANKDKKYNNVKEAMMRFRGELRPTTGYARSSASTSA